MILLIILLGGSLPANAQKDSLVRYVNPFIGTLEMGHTFPGACVPFGFVQLSPDTDTIPYEKEGKYNPEVYRYCAGYQYLDKTIVGFSHTHFSGTGHSDLGDLLLMPTVGRLQMNPGTAAHPEQGYRSAFRKETETASPGYYKVFLDDPGITAEMTASTRTGFHQYTFPETDSAHIILDLIHGIYNYGGKNLLAYLRVVNDTMVQGYRVTSGWGRTRYIYFTIVFSRPFNAFGLYNEDKPVYRGFWRRFSQNDNFPEMAGKALRAHFDFRTVTGEQIRVKVGLSAVSMQGARLNMQAEIAGWDFEAARRQAAREWEGELQKIVVQGPEELKINFYTAFYHTLMAPVVYQDLDGRYRGIDHDIHKAVGFTNYTTFSLWDTYRAQHPFLALLYPERTADMVNSMLAHYGQSPESMLPVWSHHGNENWCMIGYHAVPVVADAYVKGIKGFNAPEALRACVVTSNNQWYDGISQYRKLGYVPDDKGNNSASVTLEYAYDDYTILRFADSLSKDTSYKEADRKYAESQIPVYSARAKNFRNLFDHGTGFVRARLSDGRWKTPFDPLSTHGQGFIEGNSWNYSFYVPHEVESLKTMMGGDAVFIRRLDSLFTMHLDDRHFAETEDVTRVGLIGNYVHGNEPSHHIPYLYNWTSQPWKTQERVHQVVNTMYKNKPDGLCGNDDCGQMSAWYIFSVLGFYPVCPGSTQYALGSPCMQEALISLPGHKKLTVTALNYSPENRYVAGVSFNGKSLKHPFIDHLELVEGGKLVFIMASKPSRY
jgi:predicted alpha-1,2-mannosidase